MDNRMQENTVRVVIVAVAFFGGLALAAYAAGVFARLGGELTAMLAAFAAGFAALTYHVDPSVRAFVKRLVRSGVSESRPAARLGVR